MWNIRHRRAIVLFLVMVLLPAVAFSILIVRAVRSDRMQAAQQRGERQRQIVHLIEGDLNTWLFSMQPASAMSGALFRFQVAGDQIIFPEVHLSLPATVSAPRPRPPESTLPGGPPTAELIADFYYPRILVFLRDLRSGAQYFLRLRTLVVLMPDRTQGYAIDAQRILDHVNQRLAAFCTGEDFTGSLSIGDLHDERQPFAAAAFGLEGYSFFQVVFSVTRPESATGFRQHAFAYAMALLVLLTIVGSVLVYRTVTQEARLSALRSDFVSAVSHEFRSPLSAILALSERLETARITDPRKLAEYHEIIGGEARRLSALVTRLLEFAQIERGRKRYAFDRVELIGVARDAIQACRYAVRHDRVRLCGEEVAPLWVRADRTALQQCIHNLIENAAKYSPADSPITVTCGSINGTRTVEVRDRGIGVSAADRERIFEKFYRGREASTLDAQGVGIGLALVMHVMTSHGGSVTVESQPGEGSVFRLSLPSGEV